MALLAFGARAAARAGGWGWLALLAAALLVSPRSSSPRLAADRLRGRRVGPARGAYLAAGLRGLPARPLLGWGPGSVPWTAAAFLEPVPRVNPWGESVGDLHSLPVQIAYELGVTGLLLVAGLSVLFFVRRIAEREEGRDPALLLGGLLGLGSGAVASLGSGALAVTALPLAAAVAAGAALAGSGRGKARSSRLPVRIYALAALLALAPLEIARWHYDRARLRPRGLGKPRRSSRRRCGSIPSSRSIPCGSPSCAPAHPEGRGPAAGLALRAAEKGAPSLPSGWSPASSDVRRKPPGPAPPWRGPASSTRSIPSPPTTACSPTSRTRTLRPAARRRC